MAKPEDHGLVRRRSKRLRSKTPPLAETIVPSSSPFSFIIDVNDDLLMEILLRLPDAPFAAQTGIVSKRWSSLIFSDEFRKRFNQIHRHHLSRYLDPSYSLPYTLLFKFFQRKIDDITFTSHALSSNAPPGIHYYPKSSDYLDFLPEGCPRKRVEISSGDLVLSSLYGLPTKYCVSNPLTKQWKILPDDTMPPLPASGVGGLWLDPTRHVSERGLGEYKVVILDLDMDNYFAIDGDDHYRFRLVIFCSESGEWSERKLRAPRASALSAAGVSIDLEAVQSNGVMYYPLIGDGWGLKGFLCVDPLGSSEHCRVLDVPEDFGEGWRTELLYRVGVGAVRGRLRLRQLLKRNGAMDLKVWELCDQGGDGDDDETAWVLVHDVSAKRDRRRAVSVVAFDPFDGDVVFMVMNNCICKYNIRRDECEKVGQLPNIKRTRLEREYVLWNFLTVHTIVHTSWPLLPR